jgi:hypothetical protein
MHLTKVFKPIKEKMTVPRISMMWMNKSAQKKPSSSRTSLPFGPYVFAKALHALT